MATKKFAIKRAKEKMQEGSRANGQGKASTSRS